MLPGWLKEKNEILHRSLCHDICSAGLVRLSVSSQKEHVAILSMAFVHSVYKPTTPSIFSIAWFILTLRIQTLLHSTYKTQLLTAMARTSGRISKPSAKARAAAAAGGNAANKAQASQEAIKTIGSSTVDESSTGQGAHIDTVQRYVRFHFTKTSLRNDTVHLHSEQSSNNISAEMTDANIRWRPSIMHLWIMHLWIMYLWMLISASSIDSENTNGIEKEIKSYVIHIIFLQGIHGKPCARVIKSDRKDEDEE